MPGRIGCRFRVGQEFFGMVFGEVAHLTLERAEWISDAGDPPFWSWHVVTEKGARGMLAEDVLAEQFDFVIRDFGSHQYRVGRQGD